MRSRSCCPFCRQSSRPHLGGATPALQRRGALAEHLGRLAKLKVVEPCDKERISPGRVYVAPANYHMLVEREGIISLSTDERVNWSRPSIDVLLQSAARAWGEELIAIILSGANSDGALGLEAVKEAGGLTIAQNPAEASYGIMPQAAMDTGSVDLVMSAAEMARCLPDLVIRGQDGSAPRPPSGDAAR